MNEREERKRFHDAMSQLRGPVKGRPLGELPADPDEEHVPPALRALEGQHVTITGIDTATGEVVREEGTFTTAPGLHGDLARREQ